MKRWEFVESCLHAINCMWVFVNLTIMILYKLSKILFICLFKHKIILEIGFLIVWFLKLLCGLTFILLICIPLVFRVLFIFVLIFFYVYIRIDQIRHFMRIVSGDTSNILERFILTSTKTILDPFIYLQWVSDLFQFILLMSTIMFIAQLFVRFIIIYRATVVFCVYASLDVQQLVFALLQFLD